MTSMTNHDKHKCWLTHRSAERAWTQRYRLQRCQISTFVHATYIQQGWKLSEQQVMYQEKTVPKNCLSIQIQQWYLSSDIHLSTSEFISSNISMTAKGPRDVFLHKVAHPPAQRRTKTAWESLKKKRRLRKAKLACRNATRFFFECRKLALPASDF